MFPHRHFANRMFARRYFPDRGNVIAAASTRNPSSIGIGCAVSVSIRTGIF